MVWGGGRTAQRREGGGGGARSHIRYLLGEWLTSYHAGGHESGAGACVLCAHALLAQLGECTIVTCQAGRAQQTDVCVHGGGGPGGGGGQSLGAGTAPNQITTHVCALVHLDRGGQQ